jgi:hypothetical protein
VYVTNVVLLKGFFMTTLTTEDTQYRNEIIEMARQANFYRSEYAKSYAANIEDIEAFAKLVAADADAKATAREREACAQILANTDLSGLQDHPLQDWVAGMLFEFIKAIRARGTNE